MEYIFEFLSLPEGHVARPWITFAIGATLLLFVGTLLHRLLMVNLLRLAKRSQATWDDYLIQYIRTPTRWMMIVLALSFAIQISHLPMKDLKIVEAILKSLFILCMFWGLERVVASLVQSNVLLSALTDSSRALISVILRVSVVVVAVLMVLDTAGISITPILASLGVGSVAVALALQDTLSNLFSGLYILADKPFRVGDYVQVEGGIEGYVAKIGWRSTHIRMLANNVIVVPNSKVASSVLTNYDLTDAEAALVIPVGVSYDSDLEKVEKVTIEEAKKSMQNFEWAVKEFEPFIRYKEFGDSSINFSVIMRVKKYDEHFILRHQFIKALHKRYNQEGIEIPFPQRVVHMKVPQPTA